MISRVLQPTISLAASTGDLAERLQLPYPNKRSWGASE